MAREIVDISLLELDGQELETVRSFSITKADPKTPVKTMRRKRRALGYQRGVPDYSADLEVVLLAGDPEVDWDALQKSGQRFLIAYERGIDGQRRNLVDCIVDEITEPYDEGGETRVTVRVLALDERPE